MNQTDTVNVQLTAAGLKAANGGKLAVHGGGGEIVFEGAGPQPVTMVAWTTLLQPTAPFGDPFFEIAPAKPVMVAAGKITAAAPAPTSSAQTPATEPSSK
jgi:hypothetical protein